MITLKTLKDASAQEVFDQVSNHLLTQNKVSKFKGSINICLYRGDNNTKCAIGCLIADEEYKNHFEWKQVEDIEQIDKTHIELLKALQKVHDWQKVENWKNYLIDLAKEFNLKVNFN